MSFFIEHSLAEWRAQFGDHASVVTVGNFDGLHLGHQQILHRVAERAHNTHSLGVAVTFDPHPTQFLRPENAPLLITTVDQRVAAFEHLGLEAALVLRFDAALAQLSPEQFVDRVLKEAVNAQAVLVGANFRFGHKHAGDVALLEKLGAQRNFAVEIVPPVEVDGAPVSSTRVRQAIQQGAVEGASKLLGRWFALTGAVVPGDGRGSKILFPTLNLQPAQSLLPARGVYVTETSLGRRTHPSVTNVGVRPTFNGSGTTVESHLLDFAGEIRGGQMEVRFLKRLRDEQKFSSVDDLRAQIARDIESAKRHFAEMRKNSALQMTTQN